MIPRLPALGVQFLQAFAEVVNEPQIRAGIAGWINRRFDSVRRGYTRSLTATLRYRPVVLTVWVIVALLMVPFYLFSQRELAPNEDQGFFFGFVQGSPNATLDQTRLL